MRLFAAFLIVGFALAGALALHRYEFVRNTAPECIQHLPGYGSVYCDSRDVRSQKAWQDPTALVVLFAGVGGGGVLGLSGVVRLRAA